MYKKTIVAALLLVCIGCAPSIERSMANGPVVGRMPGYIIREFKFDSNVHCYTNGNSISCLQLREAH